MFPLCYDDSFILIKEKKKEQNLYKLKLFMDIGNGNNHKNTKAYQKTKQNKKKTYSRHRITRRGRKMDRPSKRTSPFG